MLVMFSFFSTSNLRAPSSDHRETSPHDRNRCLFYKLTPKIRGALPLKIGGKISVDFTQPPTLISNISGTAQDIQKRKANVSRSIPPAFQEKGKRSGELWSTNYRDLIVSLDQLKCPFQHTIFRPLEGAAPSNFLHALEIEEGLLVHTPRETAVPQKILIVKI